MSGPVGAKSQDKSSSGAAKRSAVPPRSKNGGGPAEVLALQREAGNQAVGELLADLGSSFGTRLTGIQIHSGPDAAARAHAQGAAAFATGRDVYLGSGIDPATELGQRVLTHELTHVVQQERGRAGMPLSSTATLEGEAGAVSGIGAEGAASYGAGAAAPGAVQKLSKKTKPAAISHFEDDLNTVVFDRPVSLEEATGLIWKSPPHDPNAILPDLEEVKSEGLQRRFRVKWQFHLQLTDSFKELLAENLPKFDPAQKLEEQGLPLEIAKIAPSLPYKKREFDEVYDVSRWHALLARWERFWGRPVVPWETTPGRKVIHRVVDDFHRFKGVRTVRGKTFESDWLVRTRNGVVEAWQLKPNLDAYIRAAGGDEDIGRRRYEAAKTCEDYVLRYWQEGWPLDDAMGLMRAEVEADFKLAVWGAAQGIQGASGQAGLRPGLGIVSFNSRGGKPPGAGEAPSETGGGTVGKTPGEGESAGQSVGEGPGTSSGAGRLENAPIPVVQRPTTPSEPPEMAARRSSEPEPANVRSRRREESASGSPYRPPHRDVGNRTPSPQAAEQQMRATGTDADVGSESPVNIDSGRQSTGGAGTKGAGSQTVKPAVASGQKGTGPKQGSIQSQQPKTPTALPEEPGSSSREATPKPTLNEPPRIPGGKGPKPSTPKERERAERLQNRSLGQSQIDPAEITRFGDKSEGEQSRVIERDTNGEPTAVEFTGRGEKGEQITVRSTKNDALGRVITSEIPNYNALSREARDKELARAMKLAGMGEWKRDLGHVQPSAAKGAEQPYNFEPQNPEWNRSVSAKINRRTAEIRFQNFLDAHPQGLLKVKVSRKLDSLNRLLSERFTVGDQNNKALFDVEVTTHGKLTQYAP